MASSRVPEREVREEARRAATANLHCSSLHKYSLLIVVGRTTRLGQTGHVGGEIERGTSAPSTSTLLHQQQHRASFCFNFFSPPARQQSSFSSPKSKPRLPLCCGSVYVILSTAPTGPRMRHLAGAPPSASPHTLLLWCIVIWAQPGAAYVKRRRGVLGKCCI